MTSETALVATPLREVLSASAIPRLLACPASAVLPHRPYDTKHAAAGTVRHTAREVAADMRDMSKLPPQVAGMIRPSDRLLAEHVFSYDTATGAARHHGPVPRELYHTLGLGPFERPGKPDLVIVGHRQAIVVDYKGFEEVESAETNAQTATYALMVARAFDLDEVTVAIVYEIRRPSIADLGPLDLDAHAARLRQLEVDVAAARREPWRYLRTGPHCKYCEAFHACPKQKALQLDVETGLISVRVDDVIPFADDEEAQWALDLLGELKTLQTRIRAALEVRASARPVPLRNGNAWGPREKLGKSKLDAGVAFDVVKEKHGPQIAELAAPRVATQKAIKDALEFVDGDPNEVFNEIRARDGWKRDKRTEIEEYEPGPKLVTDGG